MLWRHPSHLNSSASKCNKIKKGGGGRERVYRNNKTREDMGWMNRHWRRETIVGLKAGTSHFNYWNLFLGAKNWTFDSRERWTVTNQYKGQTSSLLPQGSWPLRTLDVVGHNDIVVTIIQHETCLTMFKSSLWGVTFYLQGSYNYRGFIFVLVYVVILALIYPPIVIMVLFKQGLWSFKKILSRRSVFE